MFTRLRIKSRFISNHETLRILFKRVSSEVDARHKYIGMSGGRIIYEKLLENNVKVVNGISGGASMHILDIFHPDHHSGRTPIQFISNSNEGNTGFIAEGFAKVSGEAGVILVTSGPGLTNIITPLQDAISDGVPLVAFSGQVPTNAPPDAFQCCDSIALTKPCTKWNHKLNSVEEIPAIVDYAFYIARNGRPGPVHIDCPKDIQMAKYTPDLLNISTVTIDGFEYNLNERGVIEVAKLNECKPLNSEQLDNIVNLINKSQRPILYVGRGVNNCHKELLEFAERTNIPVSTTLDALGVFDARHPLATNAIGMHHQEYPYNLIHKADLILAFGCQIEDPSLCGVSFFSSPDADLVRVGLYPAIRDPVIMETECVNVDCKSFFEEITSRNLLYRSRDTWMNTLKVYKQKMPIVISSFEDGSLSIQKVINTLNELIESYRERCLFSIGVGVHQIIAAQLITWVTPRSMISSRTLNTMGVSLGFAIGAKLADNSKLVFAIDSDYSFNMTNTELKTIMDLQIAVKILVLNYYNSTNGENCDYNKLADAHSIYNLYCENEKDLSANMTKFLDFDGPVLFHVKIHAADCLQLQPRGKWIDMLTEHTAHKQICDNILRRNRLQTYLI